MRDEFYLRQNQDCGQLWLDDRRLLWQTVRTLRPTLAVETGTWRGGGSTFFIANALRMNGRGILHSVESDGAAFREAADRYAREWSHLAPFVKLHHGDSVAVYRDALAGAMLDFVFLDGGDDTMLGEFELLAPMIRPGGVLMMHDWHNGKAESVKPLVLDNPCWSLTVNGNGNGTFEAGSVGMAKAVRR